MSQKKQARKSQVRKQTLQKSNTFEFGVFDLAVPQKILQVDLDVSWIG